MTLVTAVVGDVLTWADGLRYVSANCGEPAFSFFCLTCRHQIPNLYHLGEHLSSGTTHHIARVCRFHDLEALSLDDVLSSMHGATVE